MELSKFNRNCTTINLHTNEVKEMIWEGCPPRLTKIDLRV